MPYKDIEQARASHHRRYLVHRAQDFPVKCVESLPGEVWCVLDDFPRYAVSNLGRIKRLARPEGRRVVRHEHLLKPWPGNHDRYLRVTLCTEIGPCARLVHRLVAFAFLGPEPAPDSQVNHRNGVKTDNRRENLEWNSRSENMRHAVRTGLVKDGADAPNAKLSADEVARIRSLGGTMPQKAIAARFNVATATICNILNGKTHR